jgi:hypothetical protein
MLNWYTLKIGATGSKPVAFLLVYTTIKHYCFVFQPVYQHS